MKFDIITIFPGALESYFDTSILKRAQINKLVDIKVHDLRAFTKDKHKKVDQKPYGGGPGMLFMVEPLARALSKIAKKNSKIILFSAGGRQFDAKVAAGWAKKQKHIILIAGHYEGVDERIKKIFSAHGGSASGGKIEEISIGPYVLTGGEIPAMVVVDAVARHIPGVLGKHESLEENRLGIGVPMYTRPETFMWPPPGRGKKGKKYKVPPVLLSGDHKKIEEWRKSTKADFRSHKSAQGRHPQRFFGEAKPRIGRGWRKKHVS